MKNIKKALAALMVLILLSGVVSSAMATAAEAVLKLSGSGQASVGEYYELDLVLSDAESLVGGIEGTITYDATAFSIDSIALSSTFSGYGNKIEDSFNLETVGSIKFVGLANLKNGDTGATWFTVRFNVLSEAETDFKVTATASNKTGTDTLDISVVNKEKLDTVPGVAEVVGAAIRTGTDEEPVPADKQDLRFVVTLDNIGLPENANITEYGVLMMYTKRLGDRELTYEMIENDEYGLAVAKMTGNNLELPEGEIYANLNGIAANVDAIGSRVSARAYIVADGKVYYSNNNKNANASVADGHSSCSVVGVAKLAAAEILKTYPTEKPDYAVIKDYVENGVTRQQALELLEFVAANYWSYVK